MSVSSGRSGHCTECGCSNNDHAFARCDGRDYDKRQKKYVRCKFEWSQCSTSGHPEAVADEADGTQQYVDCLVCWKHPGGKPPRLQHGPDIKSAAQWGIPRPESIDFSQSSRKTKKAASTSSSSKADPFQGHETRLENREEYHRQGTGESSDELGRDTGWKGKARADKGKATMVAPYYSGSSDELARSGGDDGGNYLAGEMERLALEEESAGAGGSSWPSVTVDLSWKREYIRFKYKGEKRKTGSGDWRKDFAEDGSICYVFYSEADGVRFVTSNWPTDETEGQGSRKGKTDKKEEKRKGGREKEKRRKK